MRKVLIQDNFYKSVPSNKREKVDRLCEKIERELNNSKTGINGTSIAAQTKKFHNANHLFKFKASSGDRIMFTYSKYLENYRNEYGSGICLIKYTPHDKQNKEAKNFDENKVRKIDAKRQTEEILLEIEEVKQEEFEFYEYKDKNYFDLDKTIVYIKNENELSKLFQQDDEMKEVYISKQQSEYACNMKPTILLGGAGSGKTLVCLHKLNNFKKVSGEIAYFTYSEGLKNKSKKLFNKISSSSKDIDFYTLESYCLKTLGLKEKQFIDFVWFNKNFEGIKGSIELSSNINVIDIWSEIRGIIKGYMGIKWIRDCPISFKEINEISRKVLEHEYKYIKRYRNDERHIICEDATEKRFKKIKEALNADEEISTKEKKIIFEDLKKIHKMSIKFVYRKTRKNCDKRILSLEEYLDLSKDVSIYSQDERKIIHSICTNYQEYIDSKDLCDDNDLAGLTIMKLSKKPKKTFEYLVVDEIQDLTELQLYLFYNLIHNKENILFAGDVNQIINPTYFSSGRLKKLFSVNSESICESYLNKNYRSQKNIVELANKLASIRKKNIAKLNEENELLVEAINEGKPLMYLRKDDHSLKQMLLAINEKANAATIVADDEDREYLKIIMGSPATNIYTVVEIKGLEFDYIFCYNLTGKYSTYWDDIFSGKAKKNAKYRYYFNMFYVSITRARKYLCVYNEVENVYLKKELSQLFKFVDGFNAEELYLENEDKDTIYWELRAKELEEVKNFDKAISAYKRANLDNKNISRCEAKLKAKAKEYDSAIKIMLQIGEYKYAKEYAKVSGDKSMIILAAMLSGDENFEELEKEYGIDSINEVLVNNIINKEFTQLIHFNYIENYVLVHMLNDIDKINKGIIAMTGDRDNP
ncbi:AAA family ATPase [Clostridium algoriphilum]|uniref:UvrD-helicase domain-containing protein n=1 Tax=Clostridium algoriphilum TaxID=198347 RepID=UPI001CF38DA2|nr:UvrD-helicase domain-containing protein [Clostridium algoriphilum]MCB2293634.1 AAA family ATPase [Clostridium algoriphilum]